MNEKSGENYLNWKVLDLELSIEKLKNNLQFKKKLLKNFKKELK
jgi:hypothetical protein